MQDSVSLEDAGAAAAHPRKSSAGHSAVLSLRGLLLLYILFLVVCSEFFAGSVLTAVPGGLTLAGEPTQRGTLVQGVALVAGFAICTVAISENII